MRYVTDQVAGSRDARHWSQLHGLEDEVMSLENERKHPVEPSRGRSNEYHGL